MANVIYASPAFATPVKREALANATTSPGHLLLLSSGKFIKHGTDGKWGSVFVADVNFLDGLTDTYAADTTVQAFEPKDGEYYYVRAKTGQALVKGVTPLTSDGAGRVRVGVVGTDVIGAYAEVTVTTSADEQLVLVRIA